jgi:cell division control protein 6
MTNLFDNALRDDQTIFKNHQVLDYDFIPKMLPYRENEQQYLATCIKPLFRGRAGRNLFIYGEPGIGKTAATKYVLRELNEKTNEVLTVYINCWQKNTSYKVVTEICEKIGYKFTQNKKTEELLGIVAEMLDDEKTVFVFDEVDKAKDTDFLYTLLENVSTKSVFLLTNYKSWLATLDKRIKSRLMAEVTEFDAYSREETKGILENRAEHAFYDGVWNTEALDIVVDKAQHLQDIRAGLFLLKESGLNAEDDGKKRVEQGHVMDAVRKLDEFTIKNSAELENQTREIYYVVKDHSGEKIGDLYERFQEKTGSSASYKTFQRKIKKLEEAGFVDTTRKTGAGGNTTIVEKAHDIT